MTPKLLMLMKTIWAREPTLLVSLLKALLVVAAAFGLKLTDDQRNALLALAGVIVALGVALRTQVSPTALGAPAQKDGGAS